MTIRPVTFVLSEVLGSVASVGLYALVFTPTDVSLLIGAIATLITALGAAAAAIMAARRVAESAVQVKESVIDVKGSVDAATVAAARVEARVVEVKDVVHEVHAEAKVIAGHVNSAASLQVAKIDALQQELTMLRSVMAQDKETATRLAQAQANATVIAAEAQAKGAATP